MFCGQKLHFFYEACTTASETQKSPSAIYTDMTETHTNKTSGPDKLCTEKPDQGGCGFDWTTSIPRPGQRQQKQTGGRRSFRADRSRRTATVYADRPSKTDRDLDRGGQRSGQGPDAQEIAAKLFSKKESCSKLFGAKYFIQNWSKHFTELRY